jgi:hypothetical protein
VATVWVPIGFSQLGELSSGLHTYVYFNTFARLSETVVHMVMQSMFQCVGVDRPGPSGKIAMLIFVPAAQSPEGKAYFLLDGQKVLCLSEDGRDFAVLLERQWELSVTPTAVYPPMHSDPNDSSRYRRVLIGTKGSAHSGPEDCVMRDWFADYYQSRDSRDGLPIYYYSSDEKPGTRLGETRKGTGVNQDTHLPEPRYGDSNVAEPAFHQLVVKDKSP